MARTALLVLAVFYALYLTRELSLPIVLALVLAILLSPAMRWLMQLHLPRPLASAIVVLGLLGGVVNGGYAERASVGVALERGWCILGGADLGDRKGRVPHVERLMPLGRMLGR